MKLIVLAYLEEDQKCVEQLLAELRVTAYSRLPVEGREPAGTGGWYGSAAPYRSALTLVFTEDAAAGRIMDGVRACTGVEDPRHPIRAFQVDVENATACGCEREEVDVDTHSEGGDA